MKYKIVRWFLILFLFGSAIFIASASVQEMRDPLGRDYCLYLPEKIDPARTYWLVCYVHGSGGPNAYGKPNIPALLDFVARGDCIGVAPSFPSGFQLLKNRTDEQLIAILHQLSQRYHLHTKLFVFGHSAGSQYSHRFALKHPDLVVGCEACSSGTWATGGVYQSLNDAAITIPMAVACGSADQDRRGTVIARLANNNNLHGESPQNGNQQARRYNNRLRFGGSGIRHQMANRRYQQNQVQQARSEDPGWTRIEWFKKFTQQLEQRKFFFKAHIFPGDMHNVPMKEQESLALEPFLLGTSGMLPQERGTYDAAIATIKKNKADGKTDLVTSGLQQLRHDVDSRSKETVRAALLAQGWHVNEAALDQCLISSEQFVNEEIMLILK